MYVVSPRIYRDKKFVKHNRWTKWNTKNVQRNPKRGRKGEVEGKKKQREQRKTNNKRADLNPNISITTLNVNGLNKSRVS